MPQHIIKLEADGRPHYLLWSTFVDAPIFETADRGLLRDELVRKWGADREWAIDEMLVRADANGTSERGETSAEGTIGFNRAGEGETQLTVDQIIDVYIRDRPNVTGKSHFEEDDGDA